VLKESNFLYAIRNMSQTYPRSVEIALEFAHIFTLHPSEIHFLEICSKHQLYLNKYLFAYEKTESHI
jgi:hypothetical protein